MDADIRVITEDREPTTEDDRDDGRYTIYG
jgi:hypothetical protein